MTFNSVCAGTALRVLISEPRRVLRKTIRNWLWTSIKGSCRVTLHWDPILMGSKRTKLAFLQLLHRICSSRGGRRQSVGLAASLSRTIRCFASWWTPDGPTACAGRHPQEVTERGLFGHSIHLADFFKNQLTVRGSRGPGFPGYRWGNGGDVYGHHRQCVRRESRTGGCPERGTFGVLLPCAAYGVVLGSFLLS